jgi:ribosome-associated toxin RatA of RatAB toxin-antitoxin module
MRLSLSSLRKASLGAWLVLWCMGIILSPGSHLYAETEDDLRRKLETGEIIVTTKEDPGTSLKRGEMIGVIDAPPEIVWQVITDVNNFKYFMPRTINSMAVPAEKISLILQRRPSRAEEVEALLGPIPAHPASYRIPGGKYCVYLYSNLEFPWPCSNRWYIIKELDDETSAAQHRYHISWSLVIGNLRENSGEWILEPFGTTRTKAIYRLCTDPGGAIPEFLVKQGTCSTMPQIIKAVRERAAKLCKLKQP